jgi:hypothetical protein
MLVRSLHRTVRLTARSSGVLFAAAQAVSAVSAMTRHSGRSPRVLYLGFLMAHAVHFTAVTRYAVLTGGRRLFPGGRDLDDVGGWLTVVTVYTGFAALALTGARAIVPAHPNPRRRSVAGSISVSLVAAMFSGTYLGQLPQSRWFAAPAMAISTSTVANLLASHRQAQARRAR